MNHFANQLEWTSDLVNSVLLLGITVLVMSAYILRTAIRGRVRYERVDREGGSKLLGKNLKEMAYWSLQPVGRLLVFFNVTPNQISFASLVFGFLAGACLAVGHFGFGAVFAAISALLDALDGMVARLTEVASDSGEVLDATIDRYVEFFFLAGLIVYYRDIPFLVILSLFALLGSFMVSYSTAKAEALDVEPPRGNMRRSERATYLILGAWLSPISIPWLEQSTTFPVYIGYPMVVALSIVALFSNVSAVERMWAIAQAVKAKSNRRASEDLSSARVFGHLKNENACADASSDAEEKDDERPATVESRF